MLWKAAWGDVDNCCGVRSGIGREKSHKGVFWVRLNQATENSKGITFDISSKSMKQKFWDTSSRSVRKYGECIRNYIVIDMAIKILHNILIIQNNYLKDKDIYKSQERGII